MDDDFPAAWTKILNLYGDHPQAQRMATWHRITQLEAEIHFLQRERLYIGPVEREALSWRIRQRFIEIQRLQDECFF